MMCFVQYFNITDEVRLRRLRHRGEDEILGRTLECIRMQFSEIKVSSCRSAIARQRLRLYKIKHNYFSILSSLARNDNILSHLA